MDDNNSLIYRKTKRLIERFDTNDPLEIAKGSNIKIKYFSNVKNLLGMYTVIERNRYIFLNSDMNEYMMRMVLAHELGHDMLHRHLTKNSPFHEYELFDVTSQTEYEANIFAAHLLLDDDEIRELAKDQLTDIEMAGLLNVNINLLMFKLNEMNKYGEDYNLRHSPKGDFFKNIRP